MDQNDGKHKDFTPEEKEALKFLERDFNQAYQQLRHYDTQTFDLFKAAFVGYTTVMGIAVGLFQFGLKENKIITAPIVAILSTALLFGFLAVALMTRNRVYFVHVARHLNEQRRLFFKLKPLGFSNEAGMYTNPKRPAFFNRRSSQAWTLYLLSALNGAMVGLLFHLFFGSLGAVLLAVIAFICFGLQLAMAITYLVTREKKHGHESVFGDKHSPFSQA
jgi:hypothetical protein